MSLRVKPMLSKEYTIFRDDSTRMATTSPKQGGFQLPPSGTDAIARKDDAAL